MEKNHELITNITQTISTNQKLVERVDELLKLGFKNFTIKLQTPEEDILNNQEKDKSANL